MNEQKPVILNRAYVSVAGVAVTLVTLIGGVMWLTTMSNDITYIKNEIIDLQRKQDTGASVQQADSNRLTKLETQYNQIISALGDINTNIKSLTSKFK